jgi:tetratricopeptide (TPR) repeat protein
MEPADDVGGQYRAMALARLGRHAEAADCIDVLLAADAGNARSHVAAGWVALQFKNYEKAAGHLNLAIGAEPMNSWAHETLACVQSKLGDAVAARRHAKEALRLDPKARKARQLLAKRPTRRLHRASRRK